MPILKRLLSSVRVEAVSLPPPKAKTVNSFDAKRIRASPNVYFPSSELANYALKEPDPKFGRMTLIPKSYWLNLDAWAVAVAFAPITQQDVDNIPKSFPGLKKIQQPVVDDQDYTTKLYTFSPKQKQYQLFLPLWLPKGLASKIFKDMRKKYPQNVVL